MARHSDMPRHDDPTEIEPRPAAPPADISKPNVAQLKQDIDSGATGDKVPMLDPATSPLGTDAEAAGTPLSPELVAVARRTERAGRPAPQHPSDRAEDRHGLRLLGGLLLAIALAAVAFWFSFA